MFVCTSSMFFCLCGIPICTFFLFFFSALHIYLPIRQFFYDIIHPEYSPVCDVYALMFLIDVVNFIVTIYGYSAFGVRVKQTMHMNIY